MTDLPVRDALLSFEAGQPLRGALFLTYSFDGQWFEESLAPDLLERPIDHMLVLRDGNAITSEAPSVCYRKVNAAHSTVFHPKLALLVSEESARAYIGSANFTRAAFERQRELGRVYDLSPEQRSDRSLFTALASYLRTGVMREVRGGSVRTLNDIVDLLDLVLDKRTGRAQASPHRLLHNYGAPIWPQVLSALPHRVLRRAVVVSPFYEADRDRPEDPACEPDDSSMFAHLLRDAFEFVRDDGEPAVQVYFRHSGRKTELPVQKLRAYRNEVQWFAQNERSHRLHAKLVLLEGAAGPKRDPYLFALHGSPNFTSAALLREPPHGNSELAVLTQLPFKNGALQQVLKQLALDQDFDHVADFSALVGDNVDARPPLLTQAVADATFRVATNVIRLAFVRPTASGTSVRVLLRQGGDVLGTADASEVSEIDVAVRGLLQRSTPAAKVELRVAAVWVEILDANGQVISASEVPLNVDMPHEFCGLTSVGDAGLSLAERLVRAGLGTPLSYKEKQKWIEAQKRRSSDGATALRSPHQADLDRFYRDLHIGLRGISQACRTKPKSEYTFRRGIEQLVRFCVDATGPEAALPSQECALFLVDRLLACLGELPACAAPELRERLPLVASELEAAERLAPVDAWLNGISSPELHDYARGARAHLRALRRTLVKVVAT